MAFLEKNKVYLSKLQEDNREEYLAVYKVASNLHDYYENNATLWEYTCNDIGRNSDSSERYLVREKDSEMPCGYINIDIEQNHPSIDIAIHPDFRHKGYGYEAAWLLCQIVFAREPDAVLLWNVFPRNVYSRKIAEKLGGKQIDGRDILSEIMRNLLGEQAGKSEGLPNVLVYEIRKETMNP